MEVISVTFDTCSLDTVVWPQTSQHENGETNGRKVRTAIEAGHVQGFFCEPLITLERAPGSFGQYAFRNPILLSR